MVKKKKMKKSKSFNPKALRLKDLAPDPRNPRKISEDAQKGLKVSLDKFGDISGIVFNKRTGYLVAGHQRMTQIEALFKGKIKIEDNVITCPNGWTFPIRVVDWDSKFAFAANIAANSEAISGEYTKDLDSLLSEVQDYDEEIFDNLLLEELLIEDNNFPGNIEVEDYKELAVEFVKKRKKTDWLYFEPRSPEEMKLLQEKYGTDEETVLAKRLLDIGKMESVLFSKFELVKLKKGKAKSKKKKIKKKVKK